MSSILKSQVKRGTCQGLLPETRTKRCLKFRSALVEVPLTNFCRSLREHPKGPDGNLHTQPQSLHPQPQEQPLGRTPRFAAKKLSQLHQLVYARNEFATPEQLLDERRAFEQRLIQYLDERQRIENNRPQLGYEALTDDDYDGGPLLTF